MCASSRVNRHDAVLDARRVRPHTVILFGGPGDGARLQIHLPRMERTDDGVAGHDAVAERTALMRAQVVDGEKAIAEVEDGDLPLADDGRAALARRNAVARRDPDPAHDITLSIGRRGMNCAGLTG